MGLFCCTCSTGAPLACYSSCQTGGGSVQDNATCASGSGSAPYSACTYAGTAGGVVNTAQNPLPAPDASGGNGTFLSVLQQTMTQGLSCAVLGATEFGLGALNDRIAVAAGGQAQPAAAQSPAQGASGFHVSPILLIAGAVALFFILKDK